MPFGMGHLGHSMWPAPSDIVLKSKSVLSAGYLIDVEILSRNTYNVFLVCTETFTDDIIVVALNIVDIHTYDGDAGHSSFHRHGRGMP